MPIIYRIEKGAPLTSQEIDGNFKDLDTRLKTLEQHPEEGEGLGKIEVHGDQMTLTGTFGSHFGTFSLPKANLKPTGLWMPKTPYQTLDLVTSENALYCCLKEHTSTTWSQDQALWQEVLSLPKPPSSLLAIYEKATLPHEEKLGKLGIFMEDGGPTLIFFNGKSWQRLMKGENL
jgi:hypothetical protein